MFKREYVKTFCVFDDVKLHKKLISKIFIYCHFLHDKNTLHKRETIFNLRLNTVSINLLVVYRESVNLIGYITRRLSADTLQL